VSRIDGIMEQSLGIKKGSRFRYVVTVRDKNTKAIRDLTGYTAKMQIRKSLSSAATLYQTLNSPPTSGTGIDMSSAATGTLVILIDELVTATYTWSYGFYDLAIVDASGDPEYIMQGDVLLTPNVTV
jgi:hypothetical protein